MKPTAHKVFEFLPFREDNANSVVSCMTHVRENARAIRDRISREMWENVNGLYHSVKATFDPEDGDPQGTAPLLYAYRVRAATDFNGVTDGTLPQK